MDRPNVLLVIWDACRLDVVRSAASNLERLANENLWFENESDERKLSDADISHLEALGYL